MPNTAGECATLSGWVVEGWPFLFVLSFFFFTGGYVICALARATGDSWRGDDRE